MRVVPREVDSLGGEVDRLVGADRLVREAAPPGRVQRTLEGRLEAGTRVEMLGRRPHSEAPGGKVEPAVDVDAGHLGAVAPQPLRQLHPAL